MKHIHLFAELAELLDQIRAKGGHPILVGGCVRDSLFQIPIQDFDIEIFQIPLDSLLPLLSQYGSVHSVGKSFGVLKVQIGAYDIDFSSPRTELKTGPGHTGFSAQPNPFLTFDQAAARRDFTLNSIGYDPFTHRYLDPFSGIKDLHSRQLRHISAAFSEDPLRALRAMQLAARFNCSVAPETLDLCKILPLEELPSERLFEEFKKLFLKAKKPSIGLQVAKEAGILRMFPELESLIGLPQDPTWHPEGDVWTHTLMVVDAMATLVPETSEHRLMFMFAALCHDLGKALTTTVENGKWRSLGHEEAGVAPTETFLNRLTSNKTLIASILPLVKEHLKPTLLYTAHVQHKVSDAAIRRLAMRVPIDQLITLATADCFGRTTPQALNRDFPAGLWLSERAQALQIYHDKPRPLVMGKDLMALGIPPGPEMGKLLKKLFHLQLKGRFSVREEGLRLIKKQANHLIRQQINPV